MPTSIWRRTGLGYPQHDCTQLALYPVGSAVPAVCRRSKARRTATEPSPMAADNPPGRYRAGSGGPQGVLPAPVPPNGRDLLAWGTVIHWAAAWRSAPRRCSTLTARKSPSRQARPWSCRVGQPPWQL